MSILVGRNTKVLTQGMTGETGAFHTIQGIAYGTQMVAGVTPGKGGTKWQAQLPDGAAVERPVYNTVAEARDATGRASAPPTSSEHFRWAPSSFVRAEP
jgi:succinyl-CoA synthetase alpha subunit